MNRTQFPKPLTVCFPKLSLSVQGRVPSLTDGEAAIRVERLANVINPDYTGLSSSSTPPAALAGHETFATNRMVFRSRCIRDIDAKFNLPT